MFELITFCLFFLFFIYMPGWAILKKLNLPTLVSVKILLSTIIGISAFIYIVFIIRLLQIPVNFLYLFIVFDFYILYRSRFFLLKKPNFKKIISHLYIPTILLILTVALEIGSFRSGWFNGGLNLVLGRDTLWRLSIITELTKSFPPQNPAFPPVLLKNYHYLYDLLIASTSQLTKIDIVNLYTHYFSIISALLMVISFYALLRFIKINKFQSLMGTIFITTAGNLSYVLPFISKQYSFITKSNIFMSDQPFDQSYNHFNLLAYAILITLIILFSYWVQRRNFKLFLVLSIVSSVLCGIKIYAGIIGLSALGFTLFIELIKKQFKIYFFLPIIMVLPIISLISDRSFSILSFNPGWLFTKMIEDADRLNLRDMVLKEQYYKNTGNIFRFIQIKIEQIIIYLVGNFNIRLFGLFIIFKQIWKKYFLSPVFTFILAIFTIALFLPIFFSQTRAAYDSIQFTPYALISSAILTVILINYIFNKTTLLKSQVLQKFLYVLAILIVIPSNYFIFKNNLTNQFYIIDKNEIEALSFIKDSSKTSDLILTDLDADKLTNMYVNVISQTRVFFSGFTLAQQTGIDTNEREMQVKNFFIYDKSSNLDDKYKFLKDNNISYVYLSKSGLANEYFIDQLKLPLRYKNKSVSIYAVK